MKLSLQPSNITYTIIKKHKHNHKNPNIFHYNQSNNNKRITENKPLEKNPHTTTYQTYKIKQNKNTHKKDPN